MMNYARLSRALGAAYTTAAESVDAAEDLRSGLRGRAEPGSPADLIQRIARGDTPALDATSPIAHGAQAGAAGIGWTVAAAAHANYGSDPISDVAGPNTDGSGWPQTGSLASFYESHWPARSWAAELPGDPGVKVGNVHASGDHGCDAVVSLCRMGATQIDAQAWRTVWLVDVADASANPHLDFVVRDTAELIAVLRSLDKTVYLHCVAGESRTPTVAAAYLRLYRGISTDETLRSYAVIKPTANPNRRFRAYLAGLDKP